MATKSTKDDATQERPSRAFLKKFYARVRELAGAAGDALTNDLFAKAIKHARGHAGGMASAAKRKMPKEMAELVTFERAFMRTTQEGDDPAADDVMQTGLMICFYLSDDAAAQLSIPNGLAPDELHLTLAFLGDFRQYGALAKAEILTCIQDMARWSAPIVGTISGTGRFSGENGVDVFYASVDCPGLAEFRTDLVRRLANRGTPIQTEHGFDPHVTLAYIASDAQTPTFDLGDIALRFDSLFAVFGNDEVEIPMTGISSPASAGYYTEIVDMCGEAGRMRLFVEQPEVFAEIPATFNFLPKPGKYTHPEYGEMVFTRERNQRFVDNFKAGIYQSKLPIDCEHDLAQSGAVGWIVDLNMVEDGSVDAKPDWNDRGVALIEGDHFKYFSPAWFEKWTEPISIDNPAGPPSTYRDVAIGGAICKRPFFKEGSLRPLVATDSTLRIASEAVRANESGDGFTEIFFTTLTPAPAAATTNDEGVTMAITTKFDKTNPPKTLAEALALLGTISDALTARETEITTATASVLELCDKTNPPKNLTEGIAAVASKVADGQRTATEKDAARQTAEGQVRELTEKVTKLTERADATDKANRTLRFTETAKGFVGDRARHVRMMESIATKFEGGEESQEFKDYVESQTGTAEQMRASGLFDERGSTAPGPDSATAQLEAKAKKFVEDEKVAGRTVTPEAAMTQVASENAELYRQAADESRQAARA